MEKSNSTPLKVGGGGLSDRMANKANQNLSEKSQKALGAYMSGGGQTIERNTGGETGTSIFDPVLCELAYRWFSPEGGVVLDPFAGGSVRGIVAGKLGRKYFGVDLRDEQIVENRKQAETILTGATQEIRKENLITDPHELTPVETMGEYKVKREDLFIVGGVRGSKARSCFLFCQGATGIVTAGSRKSPQVNIAASIAKIMGVPVRCHTPEGTLSPEVIRAQEKGAEIIQHKAGYNSVIIKRARDDAESLGWLNVPFGMEYKGSIENIRKQVANIPKDTKRIVVTAGSGMNLAGILWGLKDQDIPAKVLAVQVGGEFKERLEKYAPKDWKKTVTTVKSEHDYHTPLNGVKMGDVILDPIYEAKCKKFLEPGDLFWIVGIRETAVPMPVKEEIPTWMTSDSRMIDIVCKGIEADLIFSCPPYADLEVYSDDPKDLSTLGYQEFLEAYREIIRKTCSLLKENSFACFVVGEVRNKQGNYYNFVGDTIQAFLDAGLEYYNEAILITAIGSLPVRVGKQFKAGRKVGKSHQNVLVFVKGDGKEASKKCGDIEIDQSLFEQAPETD